MKIFFSIFLLLFSLHSFSQTEEELVALRKLSDAANNNSKLAFKFTETTQKLPDNKAIYIGYKGLDELIKAKHAIAPYNKVSHFNKGKALLEKAINMDPDNLELRYLRFTTQVTIPSILNYDQNVQFDKKFIIRYMLKKRSLVDDHLFLRIKTYLLDSSECSITEKNSLRNKK